MKKLKKMWTRALEVVSFCVFVFATHSIAFVCGRYFYHEVLTWVQSQVTTWFS